MDNAEGVTEDQIQEFLRGSHASDFTGQKQVRTLCLRGPNFFEMGLSLDKSFHITEAVNLQFRWEVFNALNRTSLALPNNKCGRGHRQPDHRRHTAHAQHAVRGQIRLRRMR
jgi:hypothetical protein